MRLIGLVAGIVLGLLAMGAIVGLVLAKLVIGEGIGR